MSIELQVQSNKNIPASFTRYEPKSSVDLESIGEPKFQQFVDVRRQVERMAVVTGNRKVEVVVTARQRIKTVAFAVRCEAKEVHLIANLKRVHHGVEATHRLLAWIRTHAGVGETALQLLVHRECPAHELWT